MSKVTVTENSRKKCMSHNSCNIIYFLKSINDPQDMTYEDIDDWKYKVVDVAQYYE